MTIEFDGQNNKLGTTTANSVVIKTNDTDAITIDSSQNTTLAGDLTVDTDTLYVNSSSNRVGIGTSSPNTKFSVVSSTNAGISVNDGTVNTILYNTDSANGSIGTTTNHPMAFYTNNTERMRIDSSGNLVIENVVIEGESVKSKANLNLSADFDNDTSAGFSYMSFLTDGSEKMRLQFDGKLGIGTSSPSFALSVSSTSSNTITAINTASNVSRFCFAENSTPSNTYTNIEGDARSSGYLAFRTNDSERMRINSSGYIGIGNTNPVKLCEITSDSSYNTAVLLVENGNSSTFNSVVSEIRGGRATTNGSYYLFQGTNGNSSGVFRILDSGNAQNTNNSYAGTSDLKLKENIVDANSQWEDIKALPIKKYSFKLEESDTATQIGVIAQDLETAGMSGLVEETIDRDDEGTDLGTTTKSVKYSVLYMKAVKALQEALIEIDNLKARVDTLEGN